MIRFILFLLIIPFHLLLPLELHANTAQMNDSTFTLFYSNNVNGEIDPCG